jgi:hypothetical protein
MSGQVKWASNCFVMKHVKICIKGIIVNQLDFYILLRVCEWAVLSIFTVCYGVWIMRAKFSLVFVGSVKLLHSVMCVFTVISLATLLLVFVVFAHLYFTVVSFADSVLVVVVVRTLFVVVELFFDTRCLFEVGQVQVNKIPLRHNLQQGNRIMACMSNLGPLHLIHFCEKPVMHLLLFLLWAVLTSVLSGFLCASGIVIVILFTEPRHKNIAILLPLEFLSLLINDIQVGCWVLWLLILHKFDTPLGD